MPVYLSAQESGDEAIDPIQTGTAAAKGILGGRLAVTVAKNGGTWQYNLNDGNGFINCPNQAQYDIPLKVRAMNLCDPTNANVVIQYDSIGRGDYRTLPTATSYQIGITERLVTNVRHAEAVVRVYLNGSSTTATNIVFHA
jgi:hypothetical protein